MNDKIAIKQALEEKLKKLTRDIIDLKELTIPEALDSAVGRISRMDAINNRSINESALRKKKLQLEKIETAIKDFDKPGFGKCIKCGKTIPVARILLMPESKVCVNCAG